MSKIAVLFTCANRKFSKITNTRLKGIDLTNSTMLKTNIIKAYLEIFSLLNLHRVYLRLINNVSLLAFDFISYKIIGTFKKIKPVIKKNEGKFAYSVLNYYFYTKFVYFELPTQHDECDLSFKNYFLY